MNKEKIQKVIDALNSCVVYGSKTFDGNLIFEAKSIMQEEIDKPEKKPLSNDELCNLLDSKEIELPKEISCKHELLIARAVEQYHGIGIYK